MKNTIWNSDVCEMFDALVAENVERHLSEEELWDEAYTLVHQSLDDEVANLNIATDSLIAVGKLARWNGTYRVHKELRARNLGRALLEVMNSFGGGQNDFDIYVEDGRLIVSQLGHDNPVNPSILEICEGTLEKNEPCGHYAEHVYGWESSTAAIA